MSPEDRDMGYVWDIYDACADTIEFMGKIKYVDYERNKMLRSAVERKLEIIGEAAKKIQVDFKQRYAIIEWHKAIGLRNILAHEYGAVRHEIIYAIVTRNIPTLFEQMKNILTEHNELNK